MAVSETTVLQRAACGPFAIDFAQSQTNYWLLTLALSVVGVAVVMFCAGRRMAEKKLHESKNQLRATLDAVPGLLFEAGLDGRIYSYHSTRSDLLAAPPDVFPGKTFPDVLPPQVADVCMSALREAHEKGISRGKSCELPLPQGNHWLELSVSSKPVNSGQEARFIVLARDITERKQAENALRESEKMLQHAQHLAHIGYFRYAPASGVVEGSDELFRIFGLTKTQSHFSDFMGSVHPDDCVFVAATKESIIEGQGNYDFEFRLLLRDGTLKWVRAIGRFTRGQYDEAPPLLTGTVQDITERKTIEQQMRSLTAHILTVREDEKKHIAREIHDELGGTLNALKLDAYWLSRKLPANDDTTELAQRIGTMAHRIDGAIASTRRIIDDMRPAILDDLGLLAAIEWQAAEFSQRTGIDCRVECIEDEGNLDKQRSIALFRILQESLTNISRHSRASRVKIEFFHNENEVLLAVTDNGCGISESLTATRKLYSSRSYGMLGMKERVQQLGGKIIFNSPQGGGLSVKATLPLCAREEGSR